MHDRAMQALHALGLAPIAETRADPYSYGFRQGRSCADALEHAHSALCRKSSAPWVLECDIRACFDEISHQWLSENIPMDKRILHQWLKAGYLEKGQLFPTAQRHTARWSHLPPPGQYDPGWDARGHSANGEQRR
jgi:RNA-directed DNA polymerase